MALYLLYMHLKDPYYDLVIVAILFFNSSLLFKSSMRLLTERLICLILFRASELFYPDISSYDKEASQRVHLY